ncbi:hypothetical protein Tsubulata_042923 [Turnera subulata]|uniref:DNA repair protein UVH3 n=1 Tax=Turnera subulata TaxID=218843 RepID=A0A9Q0J9M2_9ROSI|nr:hypothetical protein Tsubulata_042923 [Turnera subulata]
MGEQEGKKEERQTRQNMGVHGLWDLLAPVGRRVSVETLAGKKLAIDASIWMIQFMKAMRDEKGEMVRNAHLLGFFRRICKLLYLRTKPVFVFDGGTPTLKRRTVIARRRQRENAQAKVRKTAEKLLLNHLKAMRLQELANDLEDQRKKEKGSGDKGKKKVSPDQASGEGSNPEQDANLVSGNHVEYEKLDEMLAASIAAEEGGGFVNYASTSAAADGAVEEVNSEEDEEMIMDIGDPNVSSRGKEVLFDDTRVEKSNFGRDDIGTEGYSQEKLDEMLAASMAASEGGSLMKNGSTSASIYHSDDDGQDEEEEMIIPHDKVDPSVLASLPPSMQLDLLVQMREKLMAENRQKYQKVKKVPEKFSELQIQAYLKTVAFRREIDQVQRSAAGKDLGVKRDGDEQKKTQVEHPTDSTDGNIARSNTVTGLMVDGSNDNVETYLDESGRIRVSRVRAMGMRMTRDLQRNLELMKEIELERNRASNSPNSQTVSSRTKIDSAKSFPSENGNSKTPSRKNSISVNCNKTSSLTQANDEAPMQISIEIDSENKCFDSDDDLFASLVAGDPVQFSAADNSASQRQASVSASDSDWEEGTIEEQGNGISSELQLRTKTSIDQSNVSDDSEVEWEEGVCNVNENSSCPTKLGKAVTKGRLEEEADLQEAIRRSLEDLGSEKCNHAPFEGEDINSCKENSCMEIESPRRRNNNESQAASSTGDTSKLSVVHDPDNVGTISENSLVPDSGKLNQDRHKEENLCRETSPSEPAAALDENVTHLNVEKFSGTLIKDVRLLASAKIWSEDDARSEIKEVEAGPSGLGSAVMVSNERKELEAEPPMFATEGRVCSEAEPSCDSVVKTDDSVACIEPSTKDSINVADFVQKLGAEENYDDQFDKEKSEEGQPSVMDDNNLQDLAEASLEKEMLILDEERLNLANEQSKLERNAESVSSEMFAECQELLQMFGLPYIIAPMEAEAQCAYLELANLVDGVVTDDSDVFLFGARNVYKNIFDDRKYVETYFMKDMEQELGLSREKLIRMALLLGSDYTEGISGIGIVNAIEVVNAFPEENGLHEFREWIESPDPSILGKFHVQNGSNGKKKGSKVGGNDMNNPSGEDGRASSSQNIHQAEYSQEKRTFMDKHRNVSKNWHIPSSFPSEAVISAYSSPQVDKSTEPFRWGKPDIHVLHKLCWEKFGWGIKKSDELLLPVLREYDKHETQLRLEAFYMFNERFAKIRSKRIKKAVKGITGKQSLELVDDPVDEVSKSKRKKTQGFSGDNETEVLPKRMQESAPVNNISVENSNSNRSRKKRMTAEPDLSELENLEQQSKGSSRRRSSKQSHGNGRGRGRGAGQGTGRGRRKRSLNLKEDDSSSADDSTTEDEHGVDVRNSEGPLEVRRSKRLRRAVNYAVNEAEIDGKMSLEEGEKKESDEEAMDPGLSRTPRAHGDNGSHGMEQHTEEYPAVQEDFSSDYLERGGGFCVGEGEDDQLDANLNESSFDANVSQDYLKMGGGFCVDDKEAGKDQDTGHGSPADAVGGTVESLCFSTLEDATHGSDSLPLTSSGCRTSDEVAEGGKAIAFDTELKMGNVEATSTGADSNIGMPLPQSSASYEGAAGIGGLSAMPFLKRKRRKN